MSLSKFTGPTASGMRQAIATPIATRSRLRSGGACQIVGRISAWLRQRPAAKRKNSGLPSLACEIARASADARRIDAVKIRQRGKGGKSHNYVRLHIFDKVRYLLGFVFS